MKENNLTVDNCCTSFIHHANRPFSQYMILWVHLIGCLGRSSSPDSTASFLALFAFIQ